MTLCGTVSVANMSGAAAVRDDYRYFFRWVPIHLLHASTWLMGESRFQYNKKDASFVDPPPSVDAHAATRTRFESHGFAAG
jgi:hypothetical protein